MGRMTVWTIGHSTRDIDAFLALLREHGIDRLVDVRRFPGSRLHPQFDREALRASLAAAAIAYRHAEELGGRRHAHVDSPNTAWENAGFRGYADYMATPAFRDALSGLLQEAAAASVCIMCAEAVPWRCHRNLLADALVTRGASVTHVIDSGKSQLHAMHEAARTRVDGSVFYPGPDRQLGLL